MNNENIYLKNRTVKNILNIDLPEQTADNLSLDVRLREMINQFQRTGLYYFDDYFSFYRKDIEEVLEETNGQMTKRLEIVTRFLLLVSLSTQTAGIAAEYLYKIVNELAENKDELKKLVDLLTANLSASQLAKLEAAYFSKNNEKNPNRPTTFAHFLINLYSSHSDVGPVNNYNYSTSFFSLDEHMKEAVCWQKLEFSESGNPDLSRLAAAIATKVWLFKVPLLKKYCEEKQIDFLSLSFTQRIEHTKAALEHFSEEEKNKILDGAVELELKKRKKRFKPETRKKFLNKRTSIGAELEVGLIPYEAISTYFFYESMDREKSDLFDSRPVKNITEAVANYKDLESQAAICDRNFGIVGQLIKQVQTGQGIENQTELIKQLVGQMVNQEKKALFSKYLEQGSEVNEQFLKFFQDYWKVESLRLKFAIVKAKEALESFLKNEDSHEREIYSLFRHHMSQIRLISKHRTGTDAYGEYRLDFAKGKLKSTAAFYTREMWDLAEAAFHDMDLDNKPTQITVGWEIDSITEMLNPMKEMYKELSVLNFAAFVSGWANRKFITDLIKKQVGKDERLVKSWRNTGRGELLRDRGIPGQLEFRGFSPGKYDQPRLLEAVGYLSTAARGYVAIKLNESIKTRKEFAPDRKLAAVWKKFKKGVIAIQQKFPGSTPSLENANSWSSSEYNSGIDNFFKKIVEDWDKDDGVSAEMRKLIRATVKEIKKILGD
ncbi:MAG: hypothetical protein IT416_01875 [Candidatus Pacebacteria bacterium]|nr:hypothetical protein [Candidatus Paceibacterota bacterium]